MLAFRELSNAEDRRPLPASTVYLHPLTTWEDSLAGAWLRGHSNNRECTLCFHNWGHGWRTLNYKVPLLL